MKSVVLISCVSQKRTERSRAAELYTSQLFRMNLAYARRLEPDAIYILSAKHGLLGLDEEVDPYDLTLNTMGVKEVKGWAEGVLKDLARVTDLRSDRFIFLAGERYRKYLAPAFSHVEVPMQGLPIGKQLQWLKQRVES